MRRERVTEDIYIFQSEMYAQVTAGAIVTDEGTVVIDTLPFPRETREMIDFLRGESRDKRGIRYVINTHYHADHVYGNYLFAEADIISSERCREILRKSGEKNLNEAKQSTPELADVVLRLPNLTFPDKMTFQLGERILKLVPLPGQMGIFATAPIAEGEIVSVWGGEILTPAQVAQLPESLQRYAMQVEEDFFLGGGTPDDTNYFNHSCDPNAGLSGQIVLVAMRDIAPGEEICFDYAMTDGSAYDEFECQCGAPTCRGRVRGTDWQIPELWERYRGYFIPYLQRRIDRLRAEHETKMT